MTLLKRMEIWTDGFIAAKISGLSTAACPYKADSEQATHWFKGWKAGALI